MKVLILSCNTGEGHNTAAKAIESALTARGDRCKIDDALAYLSEGMSEFICNWHVRIYRRAPVLFNTGYKVVEKTQNGSDKKTLTSRFFLRGAGRLAAAVKEGGYDLVICTHPFSAYMYTLTERERGLTPKTAFVATDYTCSPTVDKSKLDTYFIPHESLKSYFVGCFIPEHKLVATGMPVRAEFYKRVDKDLAKRGLGLPVDKRNVLLACGSMGCGPLKELAVELSQKLPHDVCLTVVCGSNSKLKQKLDRLKLPQNVRILGFTNNISLYMDSAEFIITKAGGLTCSEALAKRLPLLFINAVGGCENYNRRFFVDNGMAVETKGSIAELALELLDKPERLAEMVRAMDKIYTGNAAENICRYLHREDN